MPFFFLKRFLCTKRSLSYRCQLFSLKKFSAFITVVLLALLTLSCSKKINLKPKTSSAWSLNSIIVINSNIPIDLLHSGMSIQDVIADLGLPTRTNAAGLEFSNFGLFISPRNNEFTLFPPFTGHTMKGIGMGSSRADLITAYGRPTIEKRTRPNYELLKYNSLGIEFQLYESNVDWIDVISKVTK